MGRRGIRSVGVVALLLCLCSATSETNMDGAKSTSTWESQLKTDMMANYDYRSRPVIKSTDAVNVTVAMAYQTIVEVNMINGIVSLVVWIRIEWVDPYLAWNSTNYNGITLVGTNATSIWTPNLVILNESQKFLKDLYKSNVYSYEKGTQYWSRPGRVAFLCEFSVRHFPFDSQTCTINLGSWDFSGLQQDIQISGIGYEDLGMTHHEWNVTKFEVVRTETFYACCPTEPWPELAFSMTMVRYPQWYIQYLIFPTAAVIIMSMLSFFIHIQTGERTRLITLSNLTLISLMFISKDQLPVTSESTLIGDFFCGCIIFNLVIYLENVFLNYLWYQPRTRRVGMTAGFGTSFFERLWGLPKYYVRKTWNDRKGRGPIATTLEGDVWANGHGPNPTSDEKIEPYYDRDTPYHFDPSDPLEPMRVIKVREMQADKLSNARLGEAIDGCFRLFIPITFIIFNTVLFTIGASNLDENKASADADLVIKTGS